MTIWRILFVLFLVVVPGGSLVLLAMATAKAFRTSWEHLLERVAAPVPEPVLVPIRRRRS